jgi:hypothetical protein
MRAFWAVSIIALYSAVPSVGWGQTTSPTWYLIGAYEGSTIVATGPITLRFGQVASTCLIATSSGPCTGGAGTPTPETWTAPQTFTPAPGASTVTIVVGAAAFGGVDPVPGVVKTVEVEEESVVQNITINGGPETVPAVVSTTSPSTTPVWYLVDGYEGSEIVATGPITLRFGQVASTCLIATSSGPCTGGAGTPTPETWTAPQTFTPAPGASTVTIIVGAAAFGGVDPVPGVVKTVEVLEESVVQNITINGGPETVPAVVGTTSPPTSPPTSPAWYLVDGYEGSEIVATGPITLRFGQVASTCLLATSTGPCTGGAGTPSPETWTAPQTFMPASGASTVTIIVGAAAFGGIDPLPGVVKSVEAEEESAVQNIVVNGEPETVPALSSAPTCQLSANPSSISFPNTTLGYSYYSSGSIINNCSTALSIVSIQATGPFSASGLNPPFSLASGQTQGYTAVFTPTTTGTVTGTITFSGSSSSGQSLLIPLSGVGVAPAGQLSSSPTSLNFGNVTINSTQSQLATITNTGSASVVVSAVSVSGKGFSLGSTTTAFTLTSTQSAQIPVIFSPTSGASATGTLSITSNAQNSSLVVPLSGTGIHYVSLSWGETGSQIAGYNVYSSTVSGGPYSKINASLITPTNYNDATVAAGRTYYYVVTAVSTAGVESGYSNQVKVIVPSP